MTIRPSVSVIVPQAMRFSAGDLSAVARHAEDEGLDGVFVGDHLGGTELTLAPGAPPPPVWIGGNTAAARRRAVAHSDGWFPSIITASEVAAGVAYLAELSAGGGRTDIPAVAVGGSVLLGAGERSGTLDAHIAALTDGYRIPAEVAERLPLHGSPAAVAERLGSYADAGARHIILGLIGNDWRQQCDLLAVDPAATRPTVHGGGEQALALMKAQRVNAQPGALGDLPDAQARLHLRGSFRPLSGGIPGTAAASGTASRIRT